MTDSLSFNGQGLSPKTKKKHPGKKDKMMLICSFSFSNNVFKSFILQDLIRLNPFPNKFLVLRVCSTSLLKTLWEKQKLLVTSNFSFSHSVFYLFRELSVLSFSTNLKLSSSKSFNLDEAKICRLGKS